MTTLIRPEWRELLKKFNGIPRHRFADLQQDGSWKPVPGLFVRVDAVEELLQALLAAASVEPTESCATVDGMCLNCGTKLFLWADEKRRKRLDDHCGNCGSRRVQSRVAAASVEEPQEAKGTISVGDAPYGTCPTCGIMLSLYSTHGHLARATPAAEPPTEQPFVCAECGQPWHPADECCGDCGNEFKVPAPAAETPKETT